jgi:cytochrome b561
MKLHRLSHQSDRHSAVSIVLHWTTALLVVAIYALALAPGVIKGSIALHATLGVIVLALVALRAAWRLGEGAAGAVSESPRAIRVIGKAVHLVFYVLLAAVPVLGMMYVDAKGVPFSFFGTTLPPLVNYSRELAQTVYGVKTWLAYVLLGLIFFHAAAAIVYHHLLRRDGVLRSMLLSDAPLSAGESSHGADLAPITQ